MTSPRHTALAAKFLRESVKLDGPPPSADARDAAIVAIERAIAARSRRKRATVVLGVAGGVAAAAAIVLGLFKFIPSLRADEGVAGTSVPMLAHVSNGAAPSGAAPSGAGVMVVGANKADPTKAMPLQEGALVSQGQRVTTPANARIVFAHATGTELTLNGGSEMSIVEDDQNRIYSLGKGTLDLRVAKLKTNERLVVRTSDAEVEVRGTRFHVAVLDPATSCDGHATRVSVDEGVVVVRHDGTEARLTAGQSWPTCTQAVQEPQTPTQSAPVNPSAPPSLDERVPPQGPASNPGSSGSGSGSGSGIGPSGAGGSGGSGSGAGGTGGSGGSSTGNSGTGAPHVSSTLEEQNDLFADGIDKKHRGDMPGAAAAFERLLAKYPQSPLAESASAERLKALRTSNPARAKVAAKEYLSRWPHGFARDEAESVLREAP